jgi:hypothetical protein
MEQYPKRPRAHELETRSQRFFQNHIPDSWTCQEPQSDYGFDLRVEIFDNGQATGLVFLVQLKASDTAVQSEQESIILKISTYNYLRNTLPVVLLVKYVAPENEAYYIFLKDVPTPNEQNETFTVHIPKTNRLSTMEWESLKQYIARVTKRKLAAGRNNLVTPPVGV